MGTLPDCLTIPTFPGALILSMFACDAIDEIVEFEGTGKYQSFRARPAIADSRALASIGLSLLSYAETLVDVCCRLGRLCGESDAEYQQMTLKDHIVEYEGAFNYWA